jgi:hypothetical protein
VIVLHEGERTLAELADLGVVSGERLAAVQGIVYREGTEVLVTAPRPVVQDLDMLPLPGRCGRVGTQAGVPVAYLLGSRGCIAGHRSSLRGSSPTGPKYPRMGQLVLLRTGRRGVMMKQ